MDDLIVQSAQFVAAAIASGFAWDKIKQIVGVDKAKQLENTAKESPNELETILKFIIQSDQEILRQVQEWMLQNPDFNPQNIAVTGDNNVVAHDGGNVSVEQSGGFNLPGNQGTITINTEPKESATKKR